MIAGSTPAYGVSVSFSQHVLKSEPARQLRSRVLKAPELQGPPSHAHDSTTIDDLALLIDSSCRALVEYENHDGR